MLGAKFGDDPLAQHFIILSTLKTEGIKTIVQFLNPPNTTSVGTSLQGIRMTTKFSKGRL